MLLDLNELNSKYEMYIEGVIHIGAHLAEEAPLYYAFGVPVLWVEANPRVMNKLQAIVDQYPNQTLMNWLILEEHKHHVPFHVSTNDGMSSSVYDWGDSHKHFSPETVEVETLFLQSVTLDRVLDFSDCFLDDHTFNFLNIDVEGAGLDVLKGGPRTLARTKYVYIEVQTHEVYVGAPLLPAYDAFLSAAGFERRETGMVEGQGWGDALYIRQ